MAVHEATTVLGQCPVVARELTERERNTLLHARVSLDCAVLAVKDAERVLREAGYQANLRPLVLSGYVRRFKRRVEAALGG